jgi:carnitine-CoA ligase
MIADDRRTLPRTIMEQAERYGDKPYIVFTHHPHSPITYAGLASEAEAAGSRLSGDFEIEHGTVCAILLPNGPDFILAWGASLAAGLVDIPINYEFKKAMLLFGLKNVDARLLFTDGDGFDRLLDDDVCTYLQNLRLIVIAGDLSPNAAMARAKHKGYRGAITSLAELRQSCQARRTWEKIDGMSLSSIRYTSGTTGAAKGIMFCHLHLLNRSATHNRVMTLEQDDTLYTPFPLYHGLAGIMGAIGTLQAGATLINTPRFSASRYWTDAGAHKATLGHVLYSLVPMLLQQPERETDRHHTVRYLYSAWPHRKFEERFATKLLQIYAQSELGVMAFRRAGTEEGSRNVGLPLSDLELTIVDQFDRPLPTGESGEIVVRPRNPQSVMLGYYNNLSATMRAFRNLWHHTGDNGYLAEDGSLFFLGRLGDTIRRRGVNISSDQIDEEVMRHPTILESATIGVPSPLGEEDVHLCVTWRQPPENDEQAVLDLAAHLESRLPRQYVPRYIEPIETMAKTNTGKVRKIELRNRAVFGRTYDRELNQWLEARPLHNGDAKKTDRVVLEEVR